jgi:Uncharacterized proteins, LmbE homologs
MKTDWTSLLFDSCPDRLAIIVAHPDDEVIGCGAHLHQWPQAHVIHVTDGAPRNSPDTWRAGFVTAEEYASVRQRESITALALAGINFNQLHPLGVPDQETVLNLIPLTLLIAEKLLELQPSIVITHPYEGGHPDHDSTAFAVHMARDILLKEQGSAPVVVEATSYFNRAGIMVTGEFLPRAKSDVRTVILTEEQRQLKQRLFDCFHTQETVMRHFSIGKERFRTAPRYNFHQPPHPGRLYYEHFHLGTNGEAWRRLATAASRRLSGEPELRELHRDFAHVTD